MTGVKCRNWINGTATISININLHNKVSEYEKLQYVSKGKKLPYINDSPWSDFCKSWSVFFMKVARSPFVLLGTLVWFSHFLVRSYATKFATAYLLETKKIFFWKDQIFFLYEEVCLICNLHPLPVKSSMRQLYF